MGPAADAQALGMCDHGGPSDGFQLVKCTRPGASGSLASGRKRGPPAYLPK